ncbi:MAG TPA: anthrax toxin-like adenylyl cyclase domain-containing protein [Steroidobacteraceae bacterium]|nr:anthrax toxin-like adenylyl cyclase domain-containing protein [Steroidobacteraceae bacterium]
MSNPNYYRIFAQPQLRTVTPGAKVTYCCAQTYDTYSATDGPRDKIKWYCYNDREMAKSYNQPFIVEGPSSFRWKDAQWDFPGRHTIKCRVDFVDGRVVYYEYPQWVDGVDIVVAKELYWSRKAGYSDPRRVLTSLERYIKAVKAIEQHSPITDPDQKRKHDDQMKAHEEYRDKLGSRLKSTEASLRCPINAVHLEIQSQTQSKLNVFIACLSHSPTEQKWLLVDWTNPVDQHRAGEYEGSGATAEEAIREAVRSWHSGNSYYDGLISWEVDKRICGQPLYGKFPTTGASTWDKVSTFFTWVAVGAAVIAGIVTLILPVPGSQIISAMIWTSIFSSTAAAVINIRERHEHGFGSWKADAIDGLTIVANLFGGAGMWARGCTVVARNAEGAIVKYILVGQIAADGAQGMLLAVDKFDEFNQIMSDASLLPEERAKKLLVLFSEFSVAAVMTYFSIKGTHADLENIAKKPKYVANTDGTGPGQKRLSDLKKEDYVLDTTKSPTAEGHTSQGRQKTTIQEEQLRSHSRKQSEPVSFPDPPPPKKRGMLASHDRALAKLAEEQKVIILVRDSNENATKWIGQEGYEPKPETVKAKTIKQGEYAGLAAADPNDPKMQQLLAAEGQTYDEYVKDMNDMGYAIQEHSPYLVSNQGDGTLYYSDYDLHGVYQDGTGTNMYSPAFKDQMNTECFGGQEMVQHDPHDMWGSRNEDVAGPNRGPQPPATAYLPDGTKVHLDDIAAMKKFYGEHGISWSDKYPTDFNPDTYPAKQ